MSFPADIRRYLILLVTGVFLLNAAAAWGDCCKAVADAPVETAAIPCDHGGSADKPHDHETDCGISCVVAQVSQLGGTSIDTSEPVPLATTGRLPAQPGHDPPYRPPNLHLS